MVAFECKNGTRPSNDLELFFDSELEVYLMRKKNIMRIRRVYAFAKAQVV